MERNNEWPFDMQDPFNPLSQYEQGYMYYKFLTQQIEYKIKCKELENLNYKINGETLNFYLNLIYLQYLHNKT